MNDEIIIEESNIFIYPLNLNHVVSGINLIPGEQNGKAQNATLKR